MQFCSLILVNSLHVYRSMYDITSGESRGGGGAGSPLEMCSKLEPFPQFRKK